MAEAVLWPTLTARDHKGAPGAGTIERGGRCASLPVGVGAGAGRGTLNASFCEVFMGFPLHWTDPDRAPGVWPGWPAARGCLQHPYEPPRMAHGAKYREQRIRALGNACVPAQCIPIFQAIAAAEAEGATA